MFLSDGVGWHKLGSPQGVAHTDRMTLATEKSVKDILQEYIVPFESFIGDTFVFLPDDYILHTAEIVHLYFEELEIHLHPYLRKAQTLIS